MSYTVALHTCNLGTETAEIVNPFTGETSVVHSGEHATDSEQAAIENLLKDCGATSAGEHGDFNLVFRDGSLIELLLDDCYGTGGVALHGFSVEVCDFLIRLARVGNYALLPVVEGSQAIVTSKERADLVRERWADAVVADSAESLLARLSDQFGS